ncbi:HGGxSTG domain-containing protein [Shewanella glacialipiscicola]|uniref:HGGxSTG domain-containing protein n=1 Tax=Shewanella glacialipiscicola TaxID=614069 RepID=UPI003D7BA80C
MSRFNLETLPRCGAKTRSGNQCQRYGNKTNGRCKLHGGRSTGAKTKEGKLAVRVNALVNCLIWYFDNRFYTKIKKSDLKIAITAYLSLIELSQLHSGELNNNVIDIVALYRVELEMSKYYIAQYDGPEALLIIQSALDHYYKDTASQHLLFHVYTPVYPTPFYNREFGSKAEIEKEIQILANTMRKQNSFYSGRVTSDPVQKALKRPQKCPAN